MVTWFRVKKYKSLRRLVSKNSLLKAFLKDIFILRGRKTGKGGQCDSVDHLLASFEFIHGQKMPQKLPLAHKHCYPRLSRLCVVPQHPIVL